MAVDMENKKLELKIPEKVSDHQYVIQGIGKHEMTILVIQFLAAIGLLLICAIFGNITIGLFIGAAIVIITFFLLSEDALHIFRQCTQLHFFFLCHYFHITR